MRYAAMALLRYGALCAINNFELFYFPNLSIVDMNVAVNIEDLIKLCNDAFLPAPLGLVYCMDYLEKNIDWLESKLKPFLKDHYLLFDFPGQVELFFLHSNAKKVINKLPILLEHNGLSSMQLTAVHLVDAHLCSDPGKYVSALLLSLSTMLHLELPHINVLSKIDLIESYGKLGKSSI
ncbi:unnamed protein product [Thlaspi arvense]|uniref:GPN-loop GTPase 2 n=1 Tax=Thlaspi arvense TaxID=13288 RepID=A0AAU9SKP8_THLAR|nr:unnamed protein product [Thlaspi arvense]